MAQLDQDKTQRIIYLSAGFIKDELNFGEHQELAAWKNESLENRSLFDELVDEDKRSAAVKKMQQFGTEESLLRMKQQMEVLTEKRKNRIKWHSYAAAAILIMGLTFLFTRQQRQPQMLTVNVPYGKLMQITLPDSSKVWLNAGTTLQYPEKFENKTRNIELKEGQAFFDVVHDISKPFVVETKSAKVTVMGTSFDIKAFAGEKETKVTVSSGKVGVIPSGSQQTAIMLLANEQVVINKATKQVKTSKIISDDIASWRENKLAFEKENFQDVMNALERKYNIKIIILNKGLLQQKITLRLDNQPLADVLSVMGFSNNFTYTIQNRKLVVVK